MAGGQNVLFAGKAGDVGVELLLDEMAEPKSAQAMRDELEKSWTASSEGEPRTEWEPEIEAARQNYRNLAEQSETAGDTLGARKHREDLESAIRLARMDLSDLQALPMPKQCQGCCSGNCKSRCKGKGRCKGGERKVEDVRGASSGPPPDNRGS